MHRDDKSRYFLFIEPPAENKLKTPIDDEWTHLVERAFSEAEKGTSRYSNLKDHDSFIPESGYRGFHITACGQMSSSRDYRFKNGLITNHLCVFYMQYYRNDIHENDWVKLRELKAFYENEPG